MIPFISSILFHFGGRDQFPWCPLNQKLWRWLMGIPIGIICSLQLQSWWPMLSILTYFLATNASSYGENHPFRRWFGRDGAWLVYGAIFGLASLFCLPWYYSLLQGTLGAAAFYGLMKWSNDGYNGHKLTHKYVELGFGFLGTLIYWFAK